MNIVKQSSLIIVVGLVIGLSSCSQSSSLSGTYKGKNTLGFEYQIKFISGTDCIVSDPRRGQGPATYRIVNDHLLLTMPGGGGADLSMKGDRLTFNDDGYPVTLNKQ